MGISCWMLMREHAEHLLKMKRGLVLPKTSWKKCARFVRFPVRNSPAECRQKELFLLSISDRTWCWTHPERKVSELHRKRKISAEHPLRATCFFEHLLKETDPTKILKRNGSAEQLLEWTFCCTSSKRKSYAEHFLTRRSWWTLLYRKGLLNIS